MIKPLMMTGIGCVFIFCAGCGSPEKKTGASAATQPAATSDVDTAIDGLTGAIAVRGYQQAKDVVDRVNKQQMDENTNQF